MFSFFGFGVDSMKGEKELIISISELKGMIKEIKENSKKYGREAKEYSTGFFVLRKNKGKTSTGNTIYDLKKYYGGN